MDRPKWSFEGIDAPRDVEALGTAVLDGGFALHRALGPGGYEGTYRDMLAAWLRRRGHEVATEAWIGVEFDGEWWPRAKRIDLVVGARVVVELKSVERTTGLHEAQLLSYMRLGKYPLGYLLNFDVPLFKQGFVRYVNTAALT